MKPFHFTLEVLRTLRRRQEQTALEAYAEAARLRQQALQGRDQARLRCEAAWSDSQARLAQGMAAAELSQAQAHARLLEARCREAEKALHQAEQGLRRQWDALVSARRQVEIVETCFEKQRLRYEQACRREDQKLLDELAGRRLAGPGHATSPLVPSLNC